MLVLAAENVGDLAAVIGDASITYVRGGFVDCRRVAHVVVVLSNGLGDEEGMSRGASRPGEAQFHLGNGGCQIGDALGTPLGGVSLGKVAVLVENSVARRLDSLGVLEVGAPHTVASVARVPDEDASLGTGLQRARGVLHDVGLREGDAQVGEFGHLVGEALVGGDEAWVGRGGRSVDDVVGHATGEAPVRLVHVAVQHEGCEQRLPHVPVLLDRTKLPVIVCARHVRVDVDGAQLSAELVIEGGVAIKPAGVDGDLETHAHEVAVGFECRHSRGHSLIADVLLVHPSAGRVTEAEDAGGTTIFSRSEAALPVADADRGRDRATSVFAWFAARTSHRGDRYEEAVRYGESTNAHLGRRGKSQSAVGDLEAHAREAVVPDPFEMCSRLVAKQSPAGADSRVRCRRGGGGAVEILSDGFAHRVHADAFGAQADVSMCNLRRERVDQGGRQALDAQQLAGSALAAAIDASPIVEDPGSVGSEAGAGAVDGVASLPAPVPCWCWLCSNDI